MSPPWKEFDPYASATVARIVELGTIDGIEARPTMAPLAFDIDPASHFAAVSWAVRDLYPRDHIGWWGLGRIYTRSGEAWSEGREYDNAIVDEPFVRWDGRHDGGTLWVDMGSNMFGLDPDDQPYHSFFGFAPIPTERLLTTPENGTSRAVRISPATGAFIVVSRGMRSELAGFDGSGREVGTVTLPPEGLTEEEF